MTGESNSNKRILSNSLLEIDCDIVSKVFDEIKQKGILGQTVKCSMKDDSEEIEMLSHSNDFMDLVKMHRLKKQISMRYVAQSIGKDDETYRQYELKYNEIQDYRIAEDLIEVLELQNELELPDYFKIMKKYSKENIIEIVNKVGKKVFSEETSIPIPTINCWSQKNSGKNLATDTYKKMVDFFINHNIVF